jgi:tetratricopeptide (TPR) repeat protein
LHELATGRTPFQIRTLPEIEALRLITSTPIPKTLLPSTVELVLKKALSPEPSERYATPAEFAQDLDKFLHDRPVQAKLATVRPTGTEGKIAGLPSLFLAAAAGLILVTGFALFIGFRAANDRNASHRRFAALRAFADGTIADLPSGFSSLPGAGKLRTSLVTHAVKYLDSLAQDAQQDPALAAEVGRAYRRLAQVQEDAGAKEPERAADLLIKARRTMETAVQGQPEQVDLACELGWIYLQTAQSAELSNAEHTEALSAAEKFWRKLKERYPGEQKVLSGMAAAVSELAAQTNSAENKRMYQTEALEIYDNLLEDKPESPELIRDVASAHRALARLSDSSGRIDHLQAVLQLDERLMKADPKAHVDYPLDLTELANAYQASGNTIEANKVMDRVLAMRRKATESDPASDRTQARLAGSLTQAALLAYRQGDADTARALYGEVIGRFAKSTSTLKPDVLAEAYSGLAQVDDRDGHAVIACSSIAIAGENLMNSKSLTPDQRNRIRERIDELSARCPK